MQNIANVSQNPLGNSMGQSLSSNMLVNQRQVQGRQQMVSQQQLQQPSQSQSQYLYHPKIPDHIMKQKQQQSHSMMPSHMQQPQQQQQQNMLQPSQIQSSQQSVMQSSTVMQTTGMQAPPLTGLQQTQQPIQQTTQPMLQQHQPPMIRHQTQPQQTVHQQQIMQSQQQQTNMQQNQMINQQNNIGDMQQQSQQQQHRMLNQQNNIQNLQVQQSQQQQLLSRQNNLSNLHSQQLAPQGNVSGMHQQQSAMGTQSGNSSMQAGQHSLHMMQQTKVSAQQQMQGGPSSLLPGQQSQLPPPQQQLMSQMQSQPGLLSQQLGIQQQTSLQRDMQQRHQASAPVLQSGQNVMDQQKQIYQTQRGLAESSSMPLDSTTQAGQVSGGDWQEETYQKIKSLKEMYLPELNEMYQKITSKVLQHDSFPQQPKQEQIEKLKIFQAMVERLTNFLQLTKDGINPSLRDKLPLYEKQIVHFLNNNRPKRSHGQLPPHHIPPMQPQQSQSQAGQVQSNENQMNPQLQPMNLQGSVGSMQQNTLTGMQHGSISSFSGVTNAQQPTMSSLQSNSSMESGQGNSMNSLQHVAVGSMQQNPVSAPQQLNVNAMSSQGGGNMLPQSNVNNIQANSNILPQNLKQQEQQLQQQQIKQQLQRQMLMQKQQFIQQQQQQLSQQAKQQLPAQLQAHQMSQMHHMNEVEMKVRPSMGIKPGGFQQHHSAGAGPHPAYPHQLKSGSSFPISSPQLLQAVSPQIQQHPSPQIDQQNLPSHTRTGTPLQSASSPFVVPSPSSPLAPSPMPVDSENQKPVSSLSSLSNTGNLSHHHAPTLPAGVQSLAIGTPGISASPLLAECGPDGTHGVPATVVYGKSSATEQPIERLIRAVKSASPEALSDAISDISSVVSMVDRIAGSAPGNGSRAAIGEDLVAMTKCRTQARNFIMQDGSSSTRKIRRYISAMPLNVSYSASSMNDNFKRLMCAESSDVESTATSCIKKLRSEEKHTLIEEIREINRRLIDTVVDISNEDIDSTAAAAVVDGGEGVIVKCSFNAVSLSPGLKSQYGSAQLSPIQPLRMLIPSNYPSCSPVLLDKFPVEASKEYEDLSAKAKSRFSISLRGLSQPMSLKDIARTWDNCSRAVILEYAEQTGGGSFSSKYGTWESCQTAT
ncbi:hypothetical protein SAY86_023211 [Trapa natans]|uniref:Uncharacterized protein n=1 Tax=Trapa natans TaxID=22666 RepID=A0AAN7LU47_TRANT|nr:hypothetical protein SAY86_023211 [Trapa natans]